MREKKGWQPISHHGLVLLHLEQNPQATYRELARLLDMTERNAVRIVRDLEADGILSYKRTPQGNIYKIKRTAKIPRGVLAGQRVSRVLDILGPLLK